MILRPFMVALFRFFKYIFRTFQLEHLDQLESLCHDLGRKHAKLAVAHGFQSGYWQVFEAALCECALTWDG